MKLIVSLSKPKYTAAKNWQVGNDPLFSKYRALHSGCLELQFEGHRLQIFGAQNGYIGVIDGVVFARVAGSVPAKAKLAKDMQRSILP